MVKIPIYFDLGGMHQIAIFEEMDDGTFRRTNEQPMRFLRDNIEGLGPAVGELVTSRFDREERCWHTPTVLFNHRPQSFYHFFREQIKQRKFYVFARGSLSGRLTRFDLHELQLKSTVSRQIQSLLAKKLVEAVSLELEHVPAAEASTANIVA